jgi:hypothetical protein
MARQAAESACDVQAAGAMNLEWETPEDGASSFGLIRVALLGSRSRISCQPGLPGPCELTAMPCRTKGVAARAGGTVSGVEEKENWLMPYLNKGGLVGQQPTLSTALRAMHTPQTPIRYRPLQRRVICFDWSEVNRLFRRSMFGGGV